MVKQTALTIQTVPFETVLFLGRQIEIHYWENYAHNNAQASDAIVKLGHDIEHHLTNRCSVSELALFHSYCPCIKKP